MKQCPHCQNKIPIQDQLDKKPHDCKLTLLKGFTFGILAMALIAVITLNPNQALISLTNQNVYSTYWDNQKEMSKLNIQNIPKELKQYNYSIEFKTNYLGAYNPLLDTISIEDYDTLTSQYETLIHEIGHRIWSKTLTHKQKQEYKQIDKNETPLTNYAMKDVEESFAETIQCYYIQKCHEENNQTQHMQFVNKIIEGLKW